MARKYNDTDLDDLKRNISIEALCRSRGIDLKKHGSRDLIGKCPLPGHHDEKPSFIVTPEKNLFHCMGCDAGGSVIDLVMELDGITFREAVDQLMTSTGLIRRATSSSSQGYGGQGNKKPEKKEPAIPAERAQALLERSLSVYEKNFTETPEAKQYLDGRGITDAALFTKHRIGLSNGKLTDMLPGNGKVRKELNAVGILLDPTRSTGSEQATEKGTPRRESSRGGSPCRERFAGCVVFPVFDEEGQITTVYGRSIGDPADGGTGGKARHLYLPNRSTGLWNAQAIKSHPAIILTESVIDALSVMVAGFPNVIAVQGTNGFSAGGGSASGRKDSDIDLLKRHGVAHVTLLLDGDDAGGRAVAKLRPRLEAAGLAVTVKALPADHDPNSYLQEHGAEALKHFLASGAWTPSELPGPTPEPVPDAVSTPVRRSHCGPDEGGQAADASAQATGEGWAVTYGLRTYRVLGLDKGSHKLRATVRVEFAGKLHVDTLDFYSARSRRMLAQDLCRIFDEAPETIEGDLTRLLQACEKAATERKDSNADNRPAPVVITDADRKDAEAFGRSQNLIKRILADYEICGLVGEEHNKLLAYLAATSRKTDEPLSVLVLSSSGAGKTALQDTALLFVPPEDLVKLTSLSGKALFYKDRLSLKHKVLALEEGDGAEEASYAIRNLISAQELVIESTIKDLATGRLTTMENRVEGPSSVFLTTTNPETDPETKSRFWVTSVDEGREQTRRILLFQRQRHTLDGLVGDMAVDVILKRHRNFQRLLKPVAIVNPFADRLTYGDDRLQGRRDQPKYLNLIKAVAFLRQMQPPSPKGYGGQGSKVKYATRNGKQVAYIEVDVEDVRVANTLAHEILGRSLDELSRPGRSLLLLLDDMVEKIVERLKRENPDHGPRRTSVTFSRREIREFTGWAHTRVHRYLKELIELEYVLIDSGRNGSLCRYRLAYEGQGKNGERFMLGLTNPDELEESDGKGTQK